MRGWQAHKQFIRDMKFQTKIKLAFLFISLIPVIVLGGFCFFETRQLLLAQSEADLNANLEQSVQAVNNQLNTYNKIITFLSFNQAIINAANHTYDSAYSMYDQLKNVIDQNFYTAQYLNPDIKRITLYTGTNLPKHGSTVIPIEEITNADWYPQVMTTTENLWFFNGNKMFSVGRIFNTKLRNPKDNILYTEVEYASLFQSFESLLANGAEILVTDADGHSVYSSEKLKGKSQIPIQAGHELRWNEQDYTVLQSMIPISGWNVFLYKPTNLITASARLIILTIVLIMIACIIAVAVTGTFFARRMMSRIDHLHQNMNLVSKGVLEVTVTSDSKDEIGDLIRGFGHMVEETKTLIHKVYVEEIARKEYEMKALQAQINPHFLYNSLSLINWRAIRLRAPEISEMAQLLSTFYRTTLNKGDNMILVSDEILNVQSYMRIQLIMHSNSFEVEYQIEDEILSCRMPNLMLQPLIENAILHGIENREEGGGNICVTGTREQDCIVFQVQDNGVGIPPERLPLLLQTQSKGYGLKNVNDRAKLMYGPEYGLTIDSAVQVGTQVTLTIPVDR
ncbi:sensor histidine kinase [Paenibacillus thiaminolyticus]|uniref:histidine kinase n=1 Tax=Paenibacillus thiaminolyticus TaxID=49283 RepID=A0AAP9J0J2_PANTH|nr:sensor histidine kinase [Paenibacillus thiaminolyticus]MCY9538537.1 sensor histidine kinase [Paenibacillus thiaminolyticus]MCY9600591.1 sensor histidine kinase [Paenibacillus thiaminolyticus]MCY9608395.1 sensor histidine kinase [Paenibacillus thiaminolyticus]MCY9614804.1 sensor histidine kinase [Paenibacillus thiaminolyticus]MCY9619904.1 sensor histidine kinase [Paenibacillus thiaminolyticus]